MTDDRLEQLIKNAAREYNRPPDITPREAMWARIQEAQRPTGVAGASPMLRVERGGTDTPRRSFVPRTQWWALAVAASILLVAGIGIGRLASSGGAGTIGTSDPAKQVAVAQPLAADDTAMAPTEIPSATGGAVAERSRAVSNGGRFASDPSNIESPSTPRRSLLDIEANRMTATYQVASLRHLAEAEAMLTTFRSDSTDSSMDPVVARWSRDLLSNTRLLIDSPAARDPLRKHLLEDLELVLTQIVQLSNTPNPNEREFIESTIRDGHVMTRLRTAIPAGQPKGS